MGNVTIAKKKTKTKVLELYKLKQTSFDQRPIESFNPYHGVC